VWTQKEKCYAYPFLTEDGLVAAESWFTVLKSKGFQDENARMIKIKPKELTMNLQRLAKKAGIQSYGQHIKFHGLRKFLIDRLSLRMSESKWKQIIGKKIDEKAYVSPLQLREAYGELLDHIQLPGTKGEFGLDEDEWKSFRLLLKLFKEGKITVES